MRINRERLKERLDRINSNSVDPEGGYTRLALTKEDKAAREEVMKMMKEAGLEISIDAAGNILGVLRKGATSDKFVASGSHIDTVRNGGKFDGSFGTISAIEVAQCINESDIELKFPYEVIIFTDEEGARFNSGMIGSKSIVGLEMEEPLDTYVDRDGVSLKEALAQFGINPDKVLDAKAPEGKYKAFVEAHIEQSIVLEQENVQIGIVDGIKGPYWVSGYFEGESNHAGGTPMNRRKDPLVAASAFITRIYEIGLELGDMFVATVGVLNVKPGGINTIANKAEYTIDIRDVDMERRAKGIQMIKDAGEEIAKKYGVKFTFKKIKDTDSEVMNKDIMNLIKESADECGYNNKILSSGPFHDTLTMSKITDVGMIFVPSINGVSHSPAEDTNWEDIYAGADVLLNTIVKLATE